MNSLSARPGAPLIYLITDGTADSENFRKKSREILALIERAAEAEIALVQIREKQIPARMVFELTAKAAEITRDSRTKVLVNDRADIALTAGADGVHLTSRSLSAADVRRVFPRNFVVGVSAHTFLEVEEAKNNGADFAVFSPIFHSPQKGAPHGLPALKNVCERLRPFPIVALGGIDETNYSSVLRAGAAGFAAIRFLNDPENIKRFKAETFSAGAQNEFKED